MNYDRASRSPRIILDENITFSSLQLLLQHGLIQRCSQIYQGWRAEKTHDDQIMKQRENDAIAAGRRQLGAVRVRIKDGIMRWLVGRAVARYPCVCSSCTHAKLIVSPQIFHGERYYREYPGRFIRTRDPPGRPL